MRRIPLAAVQDAARSIYAVARRTPLIPFDVPPDSPAARAGCEIYLKLELFQPIGSFKIRGAWNAIRQMSKAELRDGVWTVSAGNAAQGVALAARMAGARCSVMVMDTAPAAKIDAIRRLGATIVSAPYDECWRTVETHHSDRMSGRFVHPFDDDRFIAGNGTIALEIVEDLPAVDAVVAPMGGGGLLAGIGAVMREVRPHVRVIAAEPETASPLAVSLDKEQPSVFDGWRSSFVDGAGGRSVLPSMWPLLAELVRESIVVSLDDVAAAMKLVAERCHLIAEGAAACAVAAALTGRPAAGIDHRPAKIACVVSGGNIDLPKYAALIGAC